VGPAAPAEAGQWVASVVLKRSPNPISPSKAVANVYHPEPVVLPSAM